MVHNKLTDAKIKALDKAGMYSDGDGLFLRVRDGGSRQWFFVYRRGAVRTEIGLGGYGQGTAPVSLRLAREKADIIREQLARGIDPHPKRRKVTTFKDIMADVLAVKTASSRNAKHAAQWKMTLENYASDLHDKPVGDITVDDVVRVLSPIWQKTPETADRLRMRIAAVIDHARARKLFSGDNPAEWRANLEHLLPSRKRLPRGHHAAAPYSAMPNIMAALRGANGVAARAVEFAVLTAARSGEVRGATWSEVDFDEATWVVSPRRSSARTPARPLLRRPCVLAPAVPRLDRPPALPTGKPQDRVRVRPSGFGRRPGTRTSLSGAGAGLLPIRSSARRCDTTKAPPSKSWRPT